MGIKEFIENVKESLGLDEFKKKSKKKSIKNLLKKLNDKKEEITLKLAGKKINKKDKKVLLEELAIINVQIKNGDKILNKLNS